MLWVRVNGILHVNHRVELKFSHMAESHSKFSHVVVMSMDNFTQIHNISNMFKNAQAYHILPAKEHSLLTGSGIVLYWLSIRRFLCSVRIFSPKHDYKTFSHR